MNTAPTPDDTPWQQCLGTWQDARDTYLREAVDAYQANVTGPQPDHDAYTQAERTAWMTYFQASRAAWNTYAATAGNPEMIPAPAPDGNPGTAVGAYDCICPSCGFPRLVTSPECGSLIPGQHPRGFPRDPRPGTTPESES